MSNNIPDYLKTQIDEIDKKIVEAKSLLSDPAFVEMANEDVKRLENEKELLLLSINSASTMNNERNSTMNSYDNRDLFIEIRGAAGGDEAKIWGEDLLNMYSKYATTQGWQVTREEPLMIKIHGRGAYGKLKYESGVHRVQRVPVTESSGRIHTSTATVAIIPELDDIDVQINPADIEEQFFRSGGKGGQNVNKVSSAVRLTHIPTGTVVTCQDERDQGKNRTKAMNRLRQVLWEKEQERQTAELSAERRAQIGTGMRNEKIRTYNFLQDRVTDHRLDQNFHNIQKIMEGNISEIITALQTKFTQIAQN
jgi:peptide chain release factor 1